jgi:Clp amino terminal domain, pathogenicity island component
MSDYHPWTTYIEAREEARRLGDPKVGTQHLVLALLTEPVVADALGSDLETARSALEQTDREALAAIGLDRRLDAPPLPALDHADVPRRPTIRAVLHDRLPMTPSAKHVLRNSSRDMRRRRPHPGPQRVLGELLKLQRPDPAAELFARLGIDPAEVSNRLPGA